MGRTCLAALVLVSLPWIAAIGGEGGKPGRTSGGQRAEELRTEIERLKRELKSGEPTEGKAKKAPPKPEKSKKDKAEKLRGEIERLKQELSEKEEVEALEKERDELKKKLEDKPADKRTAASQGSEVKFEVDRVGLFAGLGVLAVDLNIAGGGVDNLGETREEEDDSYLRTGASIFWVHLPGIIVAGNAEQYLFSDNRDEDYSQVDLQAWFWGGGYKLHHVSDSSEFLSDRIEMTRHGVGIDPRLPLAAAELGMLGLFIPSVEADFVSSGDLKYDAVTVKIGSIGRGLGRVGGVDVQTGKNKDEYGSRVNFTFGFTRRWYETRGFEDEVGLVGDLTYKHKAPEWELEMKAASRYEDDLFEMAGHKRVTDLGLDIKYVLHPRLRLRVGGGAGIEDFDVGEETYGEDRRDLFLRGKLGVDFKALRHVILHAFYAPEVRESNIRDFDATVNKIEFGLKLTF